MSDKNTLCYQYWSNYDEAKIYKQLEDQNEEWKKLHGSQEK